MSGKRHPFVSLPGEREPGPFIPVVVRAAATETGGAFEVYELGSPGGRVREAMGEGPPPHVYRAHEEVL